MTLRNNYNGFYSINCVQEMPSNTSFHIFPQAGRNWIPKLLGFLCTPQSESYVSPDSYTCPGYPKQNRPQVWCKRNDALNVQIDTAPRRGSKGTGFAEVGISVAEHPVFLCESHGHSPFKAPVPNMSFLVLDSLPSSISYSTNLKTPLPLIPSIMPPINPSEMLSLDNFCSRP